MKNDDAHPARSADFLSRLHDGELTAAERAHFESHRAHCADCRKAALEFEAALSLFRASSPSAPPPDLSARILRRLQAASPHRPPFGVVFGINLKWAAAFAVAVMATIVGSLAVLQRDSIRESTAQQTPIPVILQQEQRAAGTRNTRESGAVVARPQGKMNDAPSRRELPPAAEAQGRVARAPAPAAEALSEMKAQPPARREAEPAAPRAARSMEAQDSLLLASPERSGGEGAAATRAASAEPGSPAHLVLIALDGQGSAPEIVSPGAAELLADLRGRQFFLLVEASGRVREARPDGKKRLESRARPEDSAENATAPRSLWDLRFRPTDRPRRLLLRID